MICGNGDKADQDDTKICLFDFLMEKWAEWDLLGGVRQCAVK